MKRFYLFPIAILFLAVSCILEKPPEPEPPVEPPIKLPTKYISKIYIPGDDEVLHEMETYTWDEKNRLISIDSKLRVFMRQTFFSYDSFNRVSRVDFRGPFTLNLDDNGYYILHWNNDILDSVSTYIIQSNGNEYQSESYYYSYDEDDMCTEIFRKHGNFELFYSCKWNDENIYQLGLSDGSAYFINSSWYDNKYSPWTDCPKVPLIHFQGILYNISENNPRKFNNISYDYEYDNYDYPIKQYRTENDERKLRYVFEYKQ